MTYEAFRDQWWQRERDQDRDMRAGIIGDQQTGYRFVGPPLVLTPERAIEGAWLSSIQARAHAFHAAIIARALRTPEEEARAEDIRRWASLFGAA